MSARTINILLVDDEPLFFDLLTINREPGFEFHYLQRPCELFSAIEKKNIDLVLMDWQLGNESGLDYVKLTRAHPQYHSLPIIMLTVKSEKAFVIDGLNYGANDYVSKPFDFDILIARISAQLALNKASIPIKLDAETFEVHILGASIKLRRKEFTIFRTLLENPQRTFTRKELNGLSSGEDVFVSGRSIDTFIRYLRKKLPHPELIQTVRGKGYRINISKL